MVGKKFLYTTCTCTVKRTVFSAALGTVAAAMLDVGVSALVIIPSGEVEVVTAYTGVTNAKNIVIVQFLNRAHSFA